MKFSYIRRQTIEIEKKHNQIVKQGSILLFQDKKIENATNQLEKEKNDYGKMMNAKTEGNRFTKKIGQTVYVVRYHFNEDAKETMQEKINRMLVTEASRMAVY